MRQITRDICSAFINNEARTIGNSSTSGNHLYLHGNCIAIKNVEGYRFSFAGWNTPTTKERLNGLAELLGKGRPFHTVNFELMRDGQPISDDSFMPL